MIVARLVYWARLGIVRGRDKTDKTRTRARLYDFKENFRKQIIIVSFAQPIGDQPNHIRISYHIHIRYITDFNPRRQCKQANKAI